MLRTLSFLLFAACAAEPVGLPAGPELQDREPVVGVRPEPAPAEDSCDTAVQAQACRPDTYGVPRCSELGDGCSAPQPGGLGLQCLPGYEDQAWVPCLCVGVTAAAWCVRDEGPSPACAQTVTRQCGSTVLEVCVPAGGCASAQCGSQTWTFCDGDE